MVSFHTLALSLLAVTANANPFAAKKSVDEPKTAFMSKMMNKAQPTKNSQMRRLDGADAQVDLSSYTLRFEKCQFVKAWNDDLAADEDSESVLATQRFVVFRMCPNSSCNSNYGEYIISLEEYLESTVEYRQQEQEEMCEACEEQCAYYGQDDGAANQYYQAEGDDGADAEEEEEAEEDGDERRLAFSRKLSDMTCSQCTSDCEKIENMEDNNYMDATNFAGCVGIQDAGDDGTGALYAGPMCASSGSKIKIGVFTDEDCMFLDSSLDVEDYLTNGNGYAVKLSHALLKTTYDNEDPITCAEELDDDANAYYQAVENKEVCSELYMAAAKCEDQHDFANGINNKYYNGYYEVQDDNEELVCSFINSLVAGTYSQEGEIVVGGMASYVSGGSSTTGGQKFALTFFILGTVGLAVYAAMLHSQLTKGGKSSLSSQGGAMA